MAHQHLKSFWSPSCTSAHPTMVTLVNIMVTSFSFLMSIGCPIHEIRLFQTLTLKLQGKGHGCGKKTKVIQLAEYPINLLPFHFTSIRSTIPAEEVFWNFTLKHSRSRSWVKGQGHISYPVSNGCFSNRFDVRGKIVATVDSIRQKLHIEMALRDPA